MLVLLQTFTGLMLSILALAWGSWIWDCYLLAPISCRTGR